MPTNKVQLRRLSAIVKVLNRHDFINGKDLTMIVSGMIDLDVCKSTIEKDLFYLKEEFDAPIIAKRGSPGAGYRLEYRIDFVTLLRIHLNLY